MFYVLLLLYSWKYVLEPKENVVCITSEAERVYLIGAS